MKLMLDWKFWAGIAFSGVFLFLAVRNVDFHDVSRAFTGAKYAFLIPSIAANLIGLWIRSIRWGVLLKPVRTVKMRDLFPSTVIGFMANNLFPARIGEFVRAIVLGRRTGVRASAAFATIVLERLFDGLSILLFLFVTVGFLNLPFPGWLRRASAASAVGCVFLFVLVIALRTHTDVVMRLVKALSKPLSDRMRTRLVRLLESFVEGLRMMQNWKSVVLTFLLSLALWVFPAMAIHFALLASDIHLPLLAAFFVLAVLCIGVVVPSAPGFVGTIQYMSVLGLACFGVAKPQALSYSILYHLSQYIPVTALGLLFFFSAGMSFSKIRDPEKFE